MFPKHCRTALLALAGVALASPARAGLLHEWKLDESAGVTALDSIGGGTSTLGGISNWTSAKLNNGFATAGGNLGYVNAGNVGVSGNFAVSFWVKPEDVSLDWRNMVSKHDGAAGSKSFWIGQNATDGSLRFGLYFDGSNEVALDTPGGVISNNAWSFVTASWDEASKVQSIYVDGVLRASATRGGASFIIPRGSNLLFNTNSTSTTSSPGIGSWARFSGAVDDVSLWDAPLKSGDVKALFNSANTPTLSNFDAQTFDTVRQAYVTNLPAQVGNVRWTRATGLSLGEGIVQHRPNGYAMQLDSAGVGVSALSTISLSFDPAHTNLADTTNASENPGGSGVDQPAIHLAGNGASEIDGLSSNSSIGSADVRPDNALAGDVLVMLWLQDTQGGDDRAALRGELNGAGGSAYSVLDSSDPSWTLLAQSYGGFDTLIRFNGADRVGAINWDFATHTDVLVDRIAISAVPEPSSVGAIVGIAALLARRRR